jgi:hypothetical protein
MAAEDYITDGVELGIKRSPEGMTGNRAVGKCLQDYARIAL